MNFQVSCTKTCTVLTNRQGNEHYSDKTLAKRNGTQNEECQGCFVARSYLLANFEMEPTCETPLHLRRG